MRMIDFRAWDKKKSEIVDVMDIDFSGKKVGVCNVPKRMFKDGRLHTIHSIERDWSEAELMQYTGLKDKNGIDIYEGDIVETPSSKTKYLVDYVDGSFVGRIKYREYTSLYKGLKVIGNIYENPELLEEQNK